jgi:hypothetical protein
MKKFFPWLIAIVILALLVVRLIYRHVNGIRNETNWYVSELHYKFSAKVDSVIRPGRALIYITNGEVDTQRERRLQRDLKYNGMLWLLIPSGDRYDFLIPGKCLKSDSLYINSSKDQLKVFRNKELIISRPLSVSLRRKPFKVN